MAWHWVGFSRVCLTTSGACLAGAWLAAAWLATFTTPAAAQPSPTPKKGNPSVFVSALRTTPSGKSSKRANKDQIADSVVPQLVVVLSVDQMRADYLTRFRSLLTGEFARLLRQGAVFTNAVQDHAITETAPGHSTILSGRFPVHTGITSNSRGVRDSTVSLIGTSGSGASPRRFRGTAFADWLMAADTGTRILSISRKDRAAILPIGSSRSPVFWYAPNGMFTTSTYYSDTLPSWLQSFNAKHLASSYASRSWQPLSSEGGSFTYILPTDSVEAAATLPDFPWMDQLTLEAALAGVRALQLGQQRGTRSHTDLLSISLSATDAIGHAYGPDSPEIRDQVVRLDQFLGAFFDTLYTLCDSTRIAVVLTADHGVGPIPGVRSVDPNTDGRYVDIAPLQERIRVGLRRVGAPASAVSLGNVVTVDRDALTRAHINVDSLIAVIRDSLRATPGVLRADRISELQHMDTVQDVIARRWLHMFDSDTAATLVVTLQPYSYWGLGPSGGEHGTPHDYDARVPIILFGRWFQPGVYGDLVRVVDIAPTLAAVAHVHPKERLDGHALTQPLKSP